MINGLEVAVFGLRRAGNHAIISWITDAIGGRTVHLNDVHDKAADPYRAFNQAVILGIHPREFTRRHLGVNRYTFTRRVASLQLSCHHPHLDRRRLRSARKDCLVVSYEESILSNPRLRRFLEEGETFVGASARRSRILIVRDAANHFSSLLEKGYMAASDAAYYRNIWLAYAREFLGETNHLGPDVIRVSFNRWCESAEYRRSKARDIGFVTDGSAYHRVPRFGGGSSFQHDERDGAVLSVNGRWRAYENEPLFQSLMDAEIMSYSQEISRI